MAELRCLHCDEPFDREQGHRCLKSPWNPGTEDAITILHDIVDELDLDENEFLSLNTEQLPELSSVCAEILGRTSDPCTDSTLSKEVTFGTDQQIDSNSVSFSEKSEAYHKRLVSDVHAVPGPSRLPFNESEGSVCQEEFQPKSHHSVPSMKELWTCKFCQKVFTYKCNLKRHMKIHEGGKNHKCDYCAKLCRDKHSLNMHV
ncbi:Zinc finger and SCAN domain-containing [Argiope bruennichi]|uniref:Zinc finger and SCAN domain-containing n=1 Tax=Argiope bruennichi TaxID=94029 RepID=A0A8T0FFN9_ARGBR|nr:Zinc finger and SCAN domain-containing [Argiope bruennichi]